jgi:hypothetical protein
MVASSEFRMAVQRQPSETLAELDLSERERRRLLSVADQAGMRVNTAIHRANRLTTIAQTLPFTCFLLSARAQDVFDRYWAANPTESLQLPVECERFAAFLVTEIEAARIDDPYLSEILGFERACTKLKFYTGNELEAQGWSEDGLPLLVRIVHFHHDPVALLNALSESTIPASLDTGDFHLAIDYRSGEPDFRLVDAAGLSALEGLFPDRESSSSRA